MMRGDERRPWDRQRAKEASHSGAAPDDAAAAAFLQMAEGLGVLDLLTSGRALDPQAVAAQADIPMEAAQRYLAALEAAGLVAADPLAAGGYRAVPALPLIAHRAGYLSWAMSANRPLVENVREFLIDPQAAGRLYRRNRRDVAVSAEWMAWLALHPSAVNVMLAARAKKIVDLGAANGRLLIDALTRLPGCIGVGLDVDPDSCRAAHRATDAAGLHGRVTLLERSIQSLIDDPSPLSGSDVVHAGFVLHELLPDHETVDRILATCRKELRSGGMLAISEAIPPPHAEHEGRFGAFMALCSDFLGQELLTEREWTEKLRGAGFADVEVQPLGFPAGRLFVAHV